MKEEDKCFPRLLKEHESPVATYQGDMRSPGIIDRILPHFNP
jgi:hypothetical protein